MTGLRRTLLATLVALGALLALAGPAAADPARPTNVRSEVLAVDPPVDGVVMEVVGGDAFLRLQVDPGHEVVVPGYRDEPFLRVRADGTVEENRLSPATYLNRTRDGLARVPLDASEDAPPEWVVAGSGGEALWHDHRAHWMGTSAPPLPRTPWELAIEVDGEPVLVRGEYVRLDPPPAWPWLAVAAVGAAALAVVGWRRLGVTAGAALGAAVVALPVAWGQATAPGHGGSSVVAGPVLVLAAGLVAAGALVAGRRQPPIAGALAAGAGAGLLVWALRRLDVFDHALLVSGLPAWFERAATAGALAAGAAAALVGARWAVAAPCPAPAEAAASPGSAG